MPTSHSPTSFVFSVKEGNAIGSTLAYFSGKVNLDISKVDGLIRFPGDGCLTSNNLAVRFLEIVDVEQTVLII